MKARTPRRNRSRHCLQDGICCPGSGVNIDTPAKDVELTMDLAGAVEITIDFSNTERPKRYIVNIEPEGGNTAGSWGGSGKLDETNIRKFENIPAGKYFVFGRPHPGSTKQESARMTISIQGGETTKLTLKAR